MATYPFTISTDFPVGKINESKLRLEILASSITTPFSHVTKNADSLDIVFTGTLSAAEETILWGDVFGPSGGLIAVHDHTFLVVDQDVTDEIIDKDLTSPPGSPADKDKYIVPVGATGAWSGKDKKITEWESSTSSWLFAIPKRGQAVWIIDEKLEYHYDDIFPTGVWISGIQDVTHAGLPDLGADGHTQYHNDTRGDARYYTETELDAGQLDNQYFQESEYLNSSAGAGDSGKPIKLDAAGKINSNMIVADDDQAATEVPYTPSTGTDWVDPDPTEVGGALDDVSGRVKILEGLPGTDDQTAVEVPYTPADLTDWTPDPTEVKGALDQVADRVDTLETSAFSGDAADLTYTPSTLSDWDGSTDPGDGDDAYNQLAARTKTLEGAGGSDDQTAVEVPYTPTTGTDWVDPDPTEVLGGLDDLASRLTTAEGSAFSGDAADLTYTPGELTDWDGSADPGDGDNALDQLADRLKTVEGAGSTFGSEYQYAESLGESSKVGDTGFKEKLKLTTPSIPAGDYEILCSYNWRHENEDDSYKGRVQIDDDAGKIILTHFQRPEDDSSSQEHLGSGFAKVTLTAAVHTIDLDFGTADSSETAYIKNARLRIYRVS